MPNRGGKGHAAEHCAADAWDCRVIIEAIKESRRIFQRMNSYAIYRITGKRCAFVC